MATRITDRCILCGLCIAECPNEAISEGGVIYEIDPARCTECVGFHAEEQCAAACPVDCCEPDPERVESESSLFERARKLHPESGPSLVLDARTSRFRRPDRAGSRSTEPRLGGDADVGSSKKG